MDCIILTYNVPHRKTYDTLCRLKAKGYNEVLVYAVGLKYKKSFYPLIEQRPEINETIDTKTVSNNFGYYYEEHDTYKNLEDFKNEKILICGATIIPEGLVVKCNIINSHPGYIPNTRGLDSFKWAIFDNEPIGVTSHLLGNEIDAGWIFERKKVPIYKNDTFHTVAYRQYQMEVSMLVEALALEPKLYIKGGSYPVHKRMPHKYECMLFDKFEEYKKLAHLDNNI